MNLGDCFRVDVEISRKILFFSFFFIIIIINKVTLTTLTILLLRNTMQNLKLHCSDYIFKNLRIVVTVRYNTLR